MNSEQLASPVSAVGSPAAETEVNLRDVLGIVVEGRWIILIALVFAIAIGSAYAVLATPVYRADAIVQVEQKGKSVNEALGDIATLMTNETPIPAELEILKSRMVLGKVAESLGLDIRIQPKRFPIIGNAIARERMNAKKPADAPLGLDSYAWGGEQLAVGTVSLSRRLSNQPLLLIAGEGGSYSLFAPDGDLLLEGVAGVIATKDHERFGQIEIFVRELVARPKTEFTLVKLAPQVAVGSVARNLQVVEQGKQSGIIKVIYESANPRLAVEVANGIVDAYQRQNVERLSAEAEQTLEFLREQLPEIKKKVETAEAALNEFRLQQGSADLSKETDLVLQQSVALETERLVVVQKREEAIRRFTPNHPVVQALDAQLRQIGGRQGSISGQIKNLPETQQQLLTLTRDVEVNNALYTSLLNSFQELQIAKAGTVGNVRVIDHAVPPLGPFKPQKSVIMGLSLLVGLLLGLAAVVVRQALRHGVQDPGMVERQLGLPTYATIPYSDEQRRIMRLIKSGDRSSSGNPLLAVSDPSSLAIEALRSLRTSLHFALLESSNNIVMLTGPSPGLGKSFLSINLGAVLAMSGKRVVVVDADLRRGHLHDYLRGDRTPGVSDFVVGDVELSGIVRSTGVENLSFISTGTIPPNPAELVLHERFASLLKSLSEQFDHVLVDTPPILAVTDAAVIGSMAGTTLLVLKAGEHPMRLIDESVRRLRQAGAQVRGTLFNQMSAGGGYGYGGYGYGYGYKYGYAYSYKSVDK